MIPYSTIAMTEPRVTFWGAAQSVTGSMHLVEVGSQRLLLDCGLVRGRRDEARQRNSHFPFDPASLDAVILSHAHVDHCGNLPNLVRHGFRGPIYCTPATRDLTAVMLADSGRVQEEDAVVAGVVGQRHIAETALYTRDDARRTIDLCIPVPYDHDFALGADVQLRFVDAGHILGSALTVLTLAYAGRTYRLTFTGDLGRRGLPYLHPPSPVPAADLILCECTYGGRKHDTLEVMAAKMSQVVRGAVARGGKVLIPAFSLGRTQLVLYFLQRWMRDGILPRLPIFVDSPLAAEIALVYQRYADAFESLPPAGLPPVHYFRSPEEARVVSTQPESCVLVASGGMCDGGRIISHLRLHIDDPRTSIVLVSYQAPQTLGGAAAPVAADRALPRPQLEQVGRGRFDQRLLRPRRPRRLPGPARFGARRDGQGPPRPRRTAAGRGAGRRPAQLGFADVAVPRREEQVMVP